MPQDEMPLLLTEEDMARLFEVYMSGFVSGASSIAATGARQAGRSEAEADDLAERISEQASEMANAIMADDVARGGIWKVIVMCMTDTQVGEPGQSVEIDSFEIDRPDA